MTTLSTGATAELLVALMAMSATDSHAADAEPAGMKTNALPPSRTNSGVNPQPQPIRLLNAGLLELERGVGRLACRASRLDGRP